MKPSLRGSLLVLLAGLSSLGLTACGSVVDAPAAKGITMPPSDAGGELPEGLGHDTVAVVIGAEVRLINIDGSSRAVLKDDPFFSNVTGADLVPTRDFFAVEAYTGSGEPRIAIVTS